MDNVRTQRPQASTLQKPPVGAPDVLRAERGMFASPAKVNERIGMGRCLQQLRYHLTLQTAEAGGRSHSLTCRTYGVDRNVCGEIHTRPGYRVQGPSVTVG